ncbi:hypothetical protein C8R41DRAFT_866205 [Lentinula lateritia]|uniref:Brl1/Brr6 domain-containing protein n=1 Tax=Lentinula lateritia TaxID=40482 RepID=A0ABQ8VPS9_9AGAR|nr:hypothetical protein C8R41DRAFT_866205 [Lentinula lateritia]
MLFVTTLLPLITLALRVAAADLEQGIPLGSVSHPANVHLPSDPPPPYEALRADAIIPAAHYASRPDDSSNAQQSVSPRCLEEAEQQALAYIRQEIPNATNPQVFVGRVAEAKAKLLKYAKGVMYTCSIATAAVGFIVLIVYTEMECHGRGANLHCGHWRRNELTDGPQIEQCKRLPMKIDACSNPSTTDKPLSPSTSKAPGGHVKRDTARMSYRRRLELE